MRVDDLNYIRCQFLLGILFYYFRNNEILLHNKIKKKTFLNFLFKRNVKQFILLQFSCFSFVVVILGMNLCCAFIIIEFVFQMANSNKFQSIEINFRKKKIHGKNMLEAKYFCFIYEFPKTEIFSRKKNEESKT